jgi:hypothetical protein
VSERAMTRVRRMARTFHKGLEILNFMASREGRRLLIGAADRGVPPVTAVSAPLIERFGKKTMNPAPVRRFIGLITRAVLSKEGYVPIQAGVRIRQDHLFTAGAVYAKRFAPRPDDVLLTRVLAALSPDEMRFELSYLRQRLEEQLDTHDPMTNSTNDSSED